MATLESTGSRGEIDNLTLVPPYGWGRGIDLRQLSQGLVLETTKSVCHQVMLRAYTFHNI